VLDLPWTVELEMTPSLDYLFVLRVCIPCSIICAYLILIAK